MSALRAFSDHVKKLAGASSSATGGAPPAPAPAAPPAAPGQANVKGIQKALQKLGYDPGKIDGLMGPNTTAAIKKFQQHNGLAADGILGPKTQGALAKALQGGAPAGGAQATPGGQAPADPNRLSLTDPNAQDLVARKHPNILKVPQLKKLTEDQAKECHKYLDYHKLAALLIPGKAGLNVDDYEPGLDNKATTIDDIVRALGPLTLLNPVDELRDLVVLRYSTLVTLEIAAKKGKQPGEPVTREERDEPEVSIEVDAKKAHRRNSG